MATMATTAKASLISNRSTSSSTQPVLLGKFLKGPMARSETGSAPAMGGVTGIVASGANPASASRAAHHHQRGGTIGNRTRIGCSHGSAFAEGRMERRDLVLLRLARLLVAVTICSLLAALTVTGVISASKLPSSIAFCARVSEAMA